MMNAQDLLLHQIESTSGQIEKSLEGLEDSQLDSKATDEGMTIRSMLEHLCECYVAFLTESDGKHHEWGGYSVADKSFANLLRTYRELRTKAIERIASQPTDDLIKSASSYIVQHDAYHLGQICAARMKFDPAFDPYSIYAAH